MALEPGSDRRFGPSAGYPFTTPAPELFVRFSSRWKTGKHPPHLDGPPLTSARGRHAPSVQSSGNLGDAGDALSLDCLNNRSEIGCTPCCTLNSGARPPRTDFSGEVPRITCNGAARTCGGRTSIRTWIARH